MIKKLLESYNTISIDEFKNQIDMLKKFVTDEQWLKILSFDFALNPNLAYQIINLINKINKQKKIRSNMELIILEIRSKIYDLLIIANQEQNIIIKWLKYREIYAYYGFLETIIEGSIITDYIFGQFKNVYGKDYIYGVKNIDSNSPSHLNLYDNDKHYKEIVDLYLLMKEWQDIEHVFNNEIIINKYLETKQAFYELAYKEKPYLKKISDISLVYLYLVDNMPMVNINVLARLLISGNGEHLSKIVGGKMYGLTLLLVNDFNVPETYVIPVSAILNKSYLNELNRLYFSKFAIRSSASCEDGEKFSFAGLFSSKLNIKKAEVKSAICDVVESINSDKAQKYIEHFNLEKPYMSVVIQPSIRPEKSGVWLGDSINSGSLEWTKGSGDLLVSGHIIPNIEKWEKGLIPDNKYLKANELFVGKACLEVQKKINKCADIEWCIVNDQIVFLQLRPVTKKIKAQKSFKNKNTILGIPASPGIATGVPKFLKDFNDENFNQGEVLLSDFTDPEWIPIILKAKAIVTAEGGALSHTAIIARELGIPAVVGIGYKNIDLLKEIKTIEVNGNNGEIKL